MSGDLALAPALPRTRSAGAGGPLT